jgi:hypothetical protein
VNFWALSLRSWSGFDDFRPLRDETDPNAISLLTEVERAALLGVAQDIEGQMSTNVEQITSVN